MKNIRNFCIIAHIDHGKSTLADRLLEFGGRLTARDKDQKQMMDSMELERERGITIKAKAVRLDMDIPGKGRFEFNLIDTPGHVDFHAEVGRGLAACEGAILLVDASQGVQAQTAANAYAALDKGVVLVPALNKIDLPTARPEATLQELANFLDVEPGQILKVSAKTGVGLGPLMEAICERVPAPRGDEALPLRALVFDAAYDTYRGVVSFVRLMDGMLEKGMTVQFQGRPSVFEVEEVGVFKPEMYHVEKLEAGSVGWFTAHIREIGDVPVGGTLQSRGQPVPPIPGFREMQSMVTAAIFPMDSEEYEKLRDALGKMKLSDAALQFKPESSPALSFGFRCGFLGYLHFEIVVERLKREFGLELIATAPSVVYRAMMPDGTLVDISNPSELPAAGECEGIDEPYARARIITPPDTLAAVIKLAQERRGVSISTETLTAERLLLTYDFPMSEILVDFFDRLKSVTRGFASLDYEPTDYRPADVVRVDIHLNSEKVDALSFISPRDKAEGRGRQMCLRLKEMLPRHLFVVPIQAAIGSKIIARETLGSKGKDVTAKCYGGDITRKRKLLEKQKEGKKKMRTFGKVEVPQKAFLAILRLDQDE